MPGDQVGLGVPKGATGVSAGSIPAGVGVSVSSVCAEAAKPVGSTLWGADEIGLDNPTDCMTVAWGGSGPAATMLPNSGVTTTAGACAATWDASSAGAGVATCGACSAGAGVAGSCGARVGARIHQGVGVDRGVRVTQGFRGSWVGRMRACSTGL